MTRTAKRIIVILLLLISTFAFGQQVDCSIPKEYITDSIINGQSIKYLKRDIKNVNFCVVDKNAEFQGGDIFKFKEWVMKNIDYRNISIDSTTNDFKLNFLFTISSDGKMTDVIIAKGMNQKVDQEIYKVICSSPDWIPAKQGNKKVNQLNSLLIILKK